ncbi:hypothetical protein [Kitasatospora phosalacinea]|uniref:Secreted protein n=1 Tax=Kitasatospora phosalacinea TaxID=2065 RepID=A0ABW6GRB1_9ACTN
MSFDSLRLLGLAALLLALAAGFPGGLNLAAGAVVDEVVVERVPVLGGLRAALRVALVRGVVEQADGDELGELRGGAVPAGDDAVDAAVGGVPGAECAEPAEQAGRRVARLADLRVRVEPVVDGEPRHLLGLSWQFE